MRHLVFPGLALLVGLSLSGAKCASIPISVRDGTDHAGAFHQHQREQS